jgi:hypothetical protein
LVDWAPLATASRADASVPFDWGLLRCRLVPEARLRLPLEARPRLPLEAPPRLPPEERPPLDARPPVDARERDLGADPLPDDPLLRLRADWDDFDVLWATETPP